MEQCHQDNRRFYYVLVGFELLTMIVLYPQQVTLPSYEEALRDSGHGPVSVASATTSLGNSASSRHGPIYESGLTITAPESGHHQTAICGVNDRTMVTGGSR